MRTSMRLRLGRRYVQARQKLQGLRQAEVPAPTQRDDVPIIATGCHRSGTSLVRRVLDSHPRIACPPETQFLEPLGAVVGSDHALRGLSGIGLDAPTVAEDLGAVADGYLRAYAERRGKRRWAEKSPGVVRQLPGVDRLFGGRAQYVLICRDGMDVATSLGKGEWPEIEPYLPLHGGEPFVAAAHYWSDMNRDLLAWLAQVPERAILLRYDDLVQRPERELRRMFEFLGEEWDPGVLDFNRLPHDQGFEDHYVGATWRFEDNRGRHRALPADVQVRMWEQVRERMLELGYADRTYGRAS